MTFKGKGGQGDPHVTFVVHLLFHIISVEHINEIITQFFSSSYRLTGQGWLTDSILVNRSHTETV